MVTLIGLAVVVGAVLGGFSIAGGHIGALIHPSELLTIGGASLGALIVMSPVSVMKRLAQGLLQTLKGNPFGRTTYDELFKLMYQPDLETLLDAESWAQGLALLTDDHREGVRAFFDKRKPQFTGQ